MKITQAQIRVIKSVLRHKARTACEIQQALAEQNKKANDAKEEEAVAKVLKKYEKKLVVKINLSVHNLRRDWGNPCEVQFDEDVVNALRKEGREVLAKLRTIGSDSTTFVPIAALNMVDNYSRRASSDNSMLEVPTIAADKWKELARSIDSSFMDGDAKKLLWIIENFK